MPYRFDAAVLIAVLVGLVARPSLAEEGPKSPTSIPSLKDASAAADKQRSDAARQLDSVTEQVRQLDRELLDLRRELKKAQHALKEADEELPKLRKAAEESAVAKQSADKSLANLRKQLQEATKKANQAAKTAEESANRLSATEQAMAAAKATIESAQPRAEAIPASLDSARERLEAAEQHLQQATATWVIKQQAVEQVLKKTGDWVSFAEEIAPILNERCVACHNRSTTEGGLNLESYSALMQGGESGPAVDSGDGESSNLCLLVEDGSMPKDADPLSRAQVTLIGRWVGLGAQLDAGADATAPLIRIMPRQPQPPAPESYRVSIPVTAVAMSPDGTLLATSGYHEVLLWSTQDGRLVRRIGNIAERVADLEFHQDGERLAVAAGTPGQLGEALIINTTDGTLVADLALVTDAMLAVAFSPDHSRLAASGADRAIRLFDVETGQEQTVIEEHNDWVMDIAWSPDGTQLVSASRDKTSKLFDAESGQPLATFNGHGNVVFSAAFLTDGKTVVSAGRDRRMRLWTADRVKQTREIRGLPRDVFQLVPLPDGRLASCGAETSPRLHNSSNGKQIRRFKGHRDWVSAIDVHPQSNRLATGSYDGEVRLWDLESGETVLTFNAAPGQQQVAKEDSR